MNTDIFGHQAPAAGFEAPLEMLSACHARIQDQCETLRRLLHHLASQGVDEQARQAATAVMRYFDTAAPLHHADEEVDLFPALIESMAGSDPVCLRELAQSLGSEHRQLEAAWRRVRKGLQQVVEGNAKALAPADVEALATLYARHIDREEKELLPMAARLLGDAELDGVGRAMRERRGIAPIA
ncbi:MAG TPA: hemerythrin domain-containing protein [Caldimonas sp.]|nr:hemerythrin domain-containing protein [Caldimonas sp.]